MHSDENFSVLVAGKQIQSPTLFLSLFLRDVFEVAWERSEVAAQKVDQAAGASLRHV